MTRRGTEANSKQIRATLEMPYPVNQKEIQRLTRYLAAFNKFTSKYSEKCQSFFQTLKDTKEWTPRCEEAFREI